MCLGSRQKPHTTLDPVACPNLFKFTQHVYAMHSRIFFFATNDIIIPIIEMKISKPGKRSRHRKCGVGNCSRNPDFQFRSLVQMCHRKEQMWGRDQYRKECNKS